MKKTIKKITTSIVASTICLTSILSVGSTVNALNPANNIGHTSVTRADINSKSYISNFIRTEKKKYPHRRYWNNGDVESYTNTPCNHKNGTSTISCTRYEVDAIVGKGYLTASSAAYRYSANSNQNVYLQCYGFAFKLASDLFETNSFIYLTEKEANALGVNNFYQPRVGDHVRIGGNQHSIFITNVNTTTNKVTYVDCNADDDCQIQWNKTMTIDDLRSKLYGVYRPMLVGDFNGDTNVNSLDYTLLMNRIVGNEPENKRGLVSKYRESAGDINGDNSVDILDVIKLGMYINGTSSESYGYLVQN